MPLNEGRPQLVSPSQPSKPVEWNLPSSTAQQQQECAAKGERQEQRMEQSQTIVGGPIRHGYLSSSALFLQLEEKKHFFNRVR